MDGNGINGKSVIDTIGIDKILSAWCHEMPKAKCVQCRYLSALVVAVKCSDEERGATRAE